MENNYDSLEDQIGNAGAEETQNTQKQTLGKLKHNSIVGGKDDLSNDEDESLKDFMSSVDKKKAKQKEENIVASGWIPIDREEMGLRSMFYPEDWEFFIKPASVQAIKNWTAIDETRADQTNRVLNEICKMCVKIDTHNALSSAGWGSINSWDRFWFILKVRELTFTKGETNIEFEDECSSCGEQIKYTLTTDSLFYEYPDEDIIEKYWNGKCWEIVPRDFDLDEENVILYTPTLAKDNNIISWATEQARANKKIDETFVQFLMWMMPYSFSEKNMTQLDRYIEKCYKDYKSWSPEKFEFMDDVIRNLTINPQEQLKTTCPICGGEATSNVRFPNGIKVLFKPETKVKKFGSR